MLSVQSKGMWIQVLYLTVLIGASIQYVDGLSTTSDRGECSLYSLPAIDI